MRRYKLTFLSLLCLLVTTNSFAQTLLSCSKSNHFSLGANFSLEVTSKEIGNFLQYTYAEGQQQVIRVEELITYEFDRYGHKVILAETEKGVFDFKFSDIHSGELLEVKAMECSRIESDNSIACNAKSNLEVSIIKKNKNSVLTFSHPHFRRGEASYLVREKTTYRGSEHGVELTLKNAWENIYKFKSIDTFDGSMSVNIEQLRCN